MPHLEIHKEGRKGARLIALTREPCTIGRSSSSRLALSHYSVSRHHAVIEPSGEGYRVRDLGSSHGLKVNHVRIEAADLKDGDVVRIGPYQLFFREASASASSAPPLQDDDDDIRSSSAAPDATGEHLTTQQRELETLRTELDRARRELERDRAIAAEVKGLEARAKSLGQELAGAQAARDQSMAEVERTRQELLLARADIEHHRKAAGATQQALKDAKTALDEREATLASARQELEEARSRMAHAQAADAERLRLARQVEKLEQRLREQSEALDATRAERDSLHEASRSQTESSAAASARLQAMESELAAAKAASADLEAAIKRADDAAAEVASLRARLDESAAAQVDARHALEALQVRASSAELQAESARDLTVRLAELDAEIATLRERAAETDRLANERLDQIQSLESELANWRDTVQSQARPDSEIAALQEELETLRASTNAANRHAAVAEDAAGALRAALEESLASRAQIEAERADLAGRLAGVEGLLQLARRSLNDYESRARNAEAHAAELTARLDEQTRTHAESFDRLAQDRHAAVEETERELEALRDSHEQLVAEHEQDASALATLRETVASALAEAEQARAAAAGARNDLAAAEALLAEGELQRDAMQAEIRSLTEASAEAASRVASLVSEIARLNALDGAALRDERDRVQAALVEALRERDDVRQRLRAMDDEVVQVRRDRDGAAARADEVSARFAALEASLREALAERDQGRADLATARTERQNNLAQLASLREAHAELEAESAGLRAQLQEAGAALDEASGSSASSSDESDERIASLQLRIERLELDLQMADDRRRQAERQSTAVLQSREDLKQRIKELESSRADLQARARAALAELETTRMALAASRRELQENQAMLVKQLLNLESTDDIETVVVEMTPEELARARATGATVVELNTPRG